jgi:hypothetical protein
MKTLTITDKSPIRNVLDAGLEEDVVLVRDGHAVALLTPFDDDDAEWYARERDPAFLESIRRAREQAKRGETVSEKDLDKLFAPIIDGIDMTGFSPPVSVETLQRTKCAAVPKSAGVYVVIRPDYRPPVFLAKSVGGWFKGHDPTDPPKCVKDNWVEDALILYIGKGGGKEGLKQRLWQFMQFGLGKNIGHRGGRLIWNLQNYRQLLIRWMETPKENPEEVETRLIDRFKSARGVRPFANLNK